MKTRREFLKVCTSIAAASQLRAQTTVAAAADFKALVCVFLFGGNDANNMIVPLNSTAYNQYTAARGGVALAPGTLLPITAQGQAYGLHPQLAALQQIYNSNKNLAVVANVGTLIKPVTRQDILGGQAALPRNLYSHSDQTTQWQTSVPQETVGTGWAGRVADVLRNTYPSAFTPGISLAGNSQLLNGQFTTPTQIGQGGDFGLATIGGGTADLARQTALQQILSLDTGVKLIGAMSGILSAGLQNAAQLQQVLKSAPAMKTVFPTSGLGAQLQQAAQLLSVRSQLGLSRQIIFCSQGGYDTHSALVSSHAQLFAELGPALAAFYQATGELGVANQVTAFTESEFGRTFNPSSTAGSDHAWGSHHFVLGGAVKGGAMYGTFPTLEVNGPDDAADRGMWIPTTALDQYAATMASWFGVQAVDLPTVFPNIANFPTTNIGFMG
jgi:uncharacterized protein (DUF1501 family)